MIIDLHSSCKHTHWSLKGNVTVEHYQLIMFIVKGQCYQRHWVNIESQLSMYISHY